LPAKKESRMTNNKLKESPAKLISFDEFLEVFHKLWLDSLSYSELIEDLRKALWSEEEPTPTSVKEN
jgi:hypothetical protein